jgi:hypothetical protein
MLYDLTWKRPRELLFKVAFMFYRSVFILVNILCYYGAVIKSFDTAIHSSNISNLKRKKITVVNFARTSSHIISLSNIIWCFLQDLKELLDKSEEYLAEWRDEYVDLVQAGFQDLFTNLVDDFLSLGVKAGINSRSLPIRKPQSEPLATPSSVLVLALLSVYIYQAAVPKITEVCV